MNVGKAWHYLLVHPTKGYYTGYKGPEAFGTLEDAKIYRTEQEAYMARLVAGLDVYVESCLLWHNRTASNLGESTDENASSITPKSATENPNQNVNDSNTAGRTFSKTVRGPKKRYPFKLISNPNNRLVSGRPHSATGTKSSHRPVTLRLVT